MGWDIKDDGFGIVLSPELPSLMRKALAPAVHDFLDRNGFRLSDFNGFLFHPGGRKLIETMQEVLGLEREQLRTFVGGAAPVRQHVVGDRFVRARSGAEGRRARPASACGVRAGLFRLFCRRPICDGLWHRGAILLAFLTAQRLVELWWAKQNEARLFAAGGVEYGRSHLPLMILLHAAWLAGLWLLAYDHPVDPFFLALFVVLQLARFWVLATLGRRWTIRVIVVPGERLVARGPYRFLRHPELCGRERRDCGSAAGAGIADLCAGLLNSQCRPIGYSHSRRECRAAAGEPDSHRAERRLAVAQAQLAEIRLCARLAGHCSSGIADASQAI